MNDSTSIPSQPLTLSAARRATYLQVRDLVERLQTSHYRLCQAYAHSAAQTNETRHERTSLILQYLERRETELLEFLGRLLQEQSEGVLSTWLQYAEFSAYERQIEILITDLPREPRELQAQVAELDQELLAHYQQLATRTRTPAVQEFFRELAAMTGQRARENSEMLQQAGDF